MNNNHKGVCIRILSNFNKFTIKCYTLLQPHVCIHAIKGYYFALGYFVKVPIIYFRKLLSKTVAKASSVGSGA